MDKESGARLSLIKGLITEIDFEDRPLSILFLNLVDEMGFEPTTSSLRTGITKAKTCRHNQLAF
jgi:hypothetical protein